MKKYLLFLMFSFVVMGIQAQDLTIDDITVTVVEPDVSMNPIKGITYVHNNSSTTNTYTWTRTNISHPTEWELSVCDNNLCYLPFVNSKDFELTPGQEGLVSIQVDPKGVSGEGEVHMTVVNDANPDEAVEVTFYFVVGENQNQNLTIDATEVTVTEPDVSMNPIKGITYVHNNSSTTNTYTWTRTNISHPTEWELSVCDNNLCYLPFVNSKDFELTPGQEGLVSIQVDPKGVSGEGEVHVSVVDDADPTAAVEVTFYFNIGAVSTGDLETRSIQAFPNPIKDIFNIIDSEDAIRAITFYNIIGRKVRTTNAHSNGQYDLSDLATGLYLAQLTDREGRIIKTIRIQKQ